MWLLVNIWLLVAILILSRLMVSLISFKTSNHGILLTNSLVNWLVLEIALHSSYALHVHIVLLIVLELWSVWLIQNQLCIGHWHLIILLSIQGHSNLIIPLRPLEFILIKVTVVLLLVRIAKHVVWPLLIPVGLIVFRALNFMWRNGTFAINPFALNNVSFFLFHYFFDGFNVVVCNKSEAPRLSGFLVHQNDAID